MVSIKVVKEYLSKEAEPSWLVKVNQFFAVYTAKLLLYTPITGNQVDFLMGVLAVISCVLFSFGYFWYSIIAIILLVLQMNLDYTDGLIARYRRVAGIRGIFLDKVVHSITGPLVFFGLSLGVFRNTNNLIFLIFGILAALFIFLYGSIQHIKHQVIIIKLKEYAAGKKLDELKGKELEFIDIDSDKSKKHIFWKDIIRKTFLYLRYRYIPFILIFSIIFNFTHWVLVFYGIALPIKWLVIVFYEFKMDYKHLEYLFKPYKPDN